ncbi:MAG: hypothetical protein EB015_23000 [Methylocystaceae bacterium]|nr:hypothetical protein [Methylocystaceae bacterium]
MFVFVSFLSMLSNLINILGMVGAIAFFIYGSYVAAVYDTEQGLKLIGLSILAGIIVRITSLILRACARAGGSED